MSTAVREDTASPQVLLTIGASAGAFRTIRDIIAKLPADFVAAVVILQHFPADKKSNLGHILSSQTDLKVIICEQPQKLEPGCIYLPPEGHYLQWQNELLAPVCHHDVQPVDKPLDYFLNGISTSEQLSHIVVVLSGNGKDGSSGVRSLPEARTQILVQDPATAEFADMPQNMLRTGLECQLVTPDQIVPAICQSFDNLTTGNGQQERSNVVDIQGPVSASELQQAIKNHILNHTGFDVTRFRSSMLDRRIQNRMKESNMLDGRRYLRYLEQHDDEISRLLADLCIRVTDLFRDAGPYEKLRSSVIPGLVLSAVERDEELRLWIPGCATGEEAYSLAMMLYEYIETHSLDIGFTVYATDIDTTALKLAQKGIISKKKLTSLPEGLMELCLEPENEDYRLIPAIRDRLHFARHDLTNDPHFTGMDMISCRNTLIYFRADIQQDVTRRFYRALKPDGLLFLGASESLQHLSAHFRPNRDCPNLYQKIMGVASPLPLKLSLKPEVSFPEVRNQTMKNTETPTIKQPQLINQALETLIEELQVICIILNQKQEIGHLYGNISSYLKPFSAGKFSNRISDHIVDYLAVPLNTALASCERNIETVYYRDINIGDKEDDQKRVDLQVIPLRRGHTSNKAEGFVVQIIPVDDQAEGRPALPGQDFDFVEQSRARINDLEKELVSSREQLKFTIEELEISNDKLQVANEELMSTNEELHSTNEELHTVNDELYSVNSEYQAKIGELTQANDDLDSVINATGIGIMFLDSQLRIRRFTDPVSKYINVRHSDLSRPLPELAHQMQYDEFIDDIALVSSSNETIEKTVTTQNDQTLVIRIIPYHPESKDASAHNVLVTFTNISRRHFVENALKAAQEKLRDHQLNATEAVIPVRKPEIGHISILVLDDDETDLERIRRLLSSIPARDFLIYPHSEINEAVECARQNEIHLCITDYSLAGGTAEDFINKLKSHSINTPVIVLSAYDEEGLDSDFLTNDIADFINKDELSAQLLVRSIDYVMERTGLISALVH